MPVELEMREGFVLELYDRHEPGPDLVERRRHLWQHDPRAFAAVIRLPNGWEQHAVALWPRDIPPPRLDEIDRRSVQRDAVQFVVPAVEECAMCGERIEGLTLAGRFRFGGGRGGDRGIPT